MSVLHRPIRQDMLLHPILMRPLIIDVLSAKGMYVRSLISDIARSLNSCATTIELKRVQQGDFKIDQCLNESEWNIENIRRTIEEQQKSNPSVMKLESNNT